MNKVLTTEIISKITDIKAIIKNFKKKNLVIGLVPTMGALHIGHESLIEKAKEECDVVITSIFVNPIQFGKGEDFDKYPKQIEADKEICSRLGVDLIFAPTAEEMYPNGKNTLTEVVPSASFQNILCGNSRKGHFNGVATVVLKLFNIIKPDKSYFGQKDAQQLFIIKKMVKDLDIDTAIIGCPIIRDVDGLACSSRNKYLTESSREKALSINKALNKIKELCQTGMAKSSEVIKESFLVLHPDIDVEYFEALDWDTLRPEKEITKNTLIAIAVKIDGVRLIDNSII